MRGENQPLSGQSTPTKPWLEFGLNGGRAARRKRQMPFWESRWMGHLKQEGEVGRKLRQRQRSNFSKLLSRNLAELAFLMRFGMGWFIFVLVRLSRKTEDAK